LKPKYFLFVLLFNGITLFGQSHLQSLVQQGMNQAYNMELGAAEKTFNQILELKPNSPLGYYYIAKIHFWIYLGSRDPGEYAIFIKFADLAQSKIETQLDKNPKDYQTKYIAGNLALYRAMAQSTNNSSVDAFWSSKKAVNYFEETLELNPKFYDAYLGLGLFDYAMSFVPDFMKWAVNLTGLSSDKARGFRYIKLAFKKGTLDKTEASFHLSKIYVDYLAEYDSAFMHLQSLSSRYPKNTLFLYQYAISLIKDRQLDRADDILNRVIKLNNKKLTQITALAYFRKGEILFKRNQFRAAIKQYSKFLDSSRELDFTGLAAYNMALCYKFLGNDLQFKQVLLQARGGNQDVFEDSYAKHKSDDYLSNGITPEDLKLIRMKNYFDSGKDQLVYDSLKTMLVSLVDKENKPLALIYFAEAAENLKKYSEVIHAADQIENIKLSSDKWIKPMAEYQEAKAKYLTGQKEEAKDLLKDAENDNEFEFKDYIQSQIEWLKRKLNR
jgi:tetratricopeptide (TPR) repeat protein